MGGSSSTNGSDEKLIQRFVGDQKVRDYLENLKVDGRTILKWILKKYG
jgi:hypothetical protein